MANDLSILKRGIHFHPAKLGCLKVICCQWKGQEKKRYSYTFYFQWVFESCPSYYISMKCYNIFLKAEVSVSFLCIFFYAVSPKDFYALDPVKHHCTDLGSQSQTGRKRAYPKGLCSNLLS